MKQNYINDDVVIDFYVPDCLKNLMIDAEQADKEENLGYYLMLADSIDVWAKIIMLTEFSRRNNGI